VLLCMLEAVDGGLCSLEVPEMMRGVILCLLEMLEVAEVMCCMLLCLLGLSEMLEVLEVMHRVWLCIQEAVEGRLCLQEVTEVMGYVLLRMQEAVFPRGAGGAGGDVLYVLCLLEALEWCK